MGKKGEKLKALENELASLLNAEPEKRRNANWWQDKVAGLYSKLRLGG